ncbi:MULTISPECIES: PH domain-containing protein [Acinetobacter]|uniref:PH domain-containing protein n=1 Tax=Acinetobacter TaxID=469 RepID=UPI0013628FAA|nr:MULTISPECIES: PH domain-containing protein [Acinetobacter]MDM1273886.1 PH domain-containing protein [Acinetobacter indicus]MDM1279334.1 PH domain-containing protein [Acinetobacter indicus]MDM1302678.1 PH domain-containing protein [Acinetobacter indicus]MDM1493781.1 PH domain-containing protein [Acinetobacter indicus]
MQKYKSKIDWWVIIVLTGSSLLLLTLVYSNFDSQNLHEDIIFSVLFSSLALVVWLPIPTTYYVVDGEILKIHSIFLKWEIPLSSIEKIKETSDSLSAPALSLDRIKIEYKKDGIHKSIMVSPRNKTEFIKQVSSRI